MPKKYQITPMMQHYLDTKQMYPDSILFYRLGDFYEMFYEDAQTVSRELELTLTGKDCGLEERAPMCGVPYHAAPMYIQKLIGKGYKVAICEQVEDPRAAKGMVKREVIRVVTPGTIVDEALLDEKSNNYLAVVYSEMGAGGVAFADVSTGEVYVTEVDGFDKMLNEIARYMPKEVLINKDAYNGIGEEIHRRFYVKPEVHEDRFFEGKNEEAIEKQFNKSIDELGLKDKRYAIMATGTILGYLEYAQKTSVLFIDKLNLYEVEQYMDLDAATRRNLEITETMRDKSKRGSLLWVLDYTKTSMGARLLRQWVEKPLLNHVQINNRLAAVGELTENIMLRDELRGILSQTYDISRIISRLSLGTATPKDLVALKNTLTVLPELEYKLSDTKASMLAHMGKGFDRIEDVRDLLERAISDDAPAMLKDGNVIKPGYHAEIDHLRAAKTDGREWLAKIESEEKQKTGIPKLKIGYNKVFGYFIEVTKSFIKDVPERYIRKQTLANCERYITEELKEVENTILGASERVLGLEAHVFEQIRNGLVRSLDRFKRASDIIALTDTLCSLAEAAFRGGYNMPDVDDSGVIEIKEGRHPVVERMAKTFMFVPNDTNMNCESDRLLMITGPNMAGKSTYMRQVAIITLMAQIGSFVPARKAHIGVVDKIFTRVGASDDIASGQSTFMLEMTEVSNILNNATDKSLIILDEIGRGTSTFDGLSLFNVQLRDPTLAYPIFRSESKERLESLLRLDGRNAGYLPDAGTEAASPDLTWAQNAHKLDAAPKPGPEVTTTTEAIYPGEKNGLPFDVVIERLHFGEPEHSQPEQAAQPSARNFRITDDHLGEGGPKAKFRMNMDAINLLKELEFDGRQATPEEQEVLSRYVGWGGLADAFDEKKDGWANEFKELYAALSPEEYAAARASTLNAHYTSPTVIKAIYEAVGSMGFQSGNILEPSMGVGNFFGLLPDHMAGSRLYGVELDSITGRIAQKLYPEADIKVAGFETTDRRDFYDLCIGNVPFGDYKVNDKPYNKLGFSIHNYFFGATRS